MSWQCMNKAKTKKTGVAEAENIELSSAWLTKRKPV